MSLLYVYICIISILMTDSARILGIFIVKSRSHHSINQPIFEELANRGHQVTVISHFKAKFNSSNYKDIQLSEGLPSYIDSIGVNETDQLTGLASYINAVRTTEVEGCNNVFSNQYVKSILNSNRKEFDLLIVEMYHTLCYNMLAYKYGVPIIAVLPPSTVTGPDLMSGNPSSPAYIPLVIERYTMKMNFLERLVNSVGFLMLYILHYTKFNDRLKTIADEHLDMDVPSIDVLHKRLALVLYNNHLSFMARPLAPNVIDIGGIHIKAQVLPKINRQLGLLLNEILNYGSVCDEFKELKSYLDKASNGVIYFSFGSTVKASSMPPEVIDLFMKTFSTIPQNVLWRVDRAFNYTDKIPSNVKIDLWLPQVALLNHKKVYAFISHCGLLGTLEAIDSGTPVIGIPFMFDQFQNAKILEEKKVSIVLDYDHLDANQLEFAIREIINNKSYRNNMENLSRIFKDRPMSPLDTATYWIEYVLKHNGAPHLRTPAADMPFYRYYLLDIFSFVMISSLSIFYIFLKIVKHLSKLLAKNNKVKYQ